MSVCIFSCGKRAKNDVKTRRNGTLPVVISTRRYEIVTFKCDEPAFSSFKREGKFIIQIAAQIFGMKNVKCLLISSWKMHTFVHFINFVYRSTFFVFFPFLISHKFKYQCFGNFLLFTVFLSCSLSAIDWRCEVTLT